MATLYKKSEKRPLPAGAEIITRKGKRVARWTDGRGRRQTADLREDGQFILLESPIWWARYVDHAGIERRVSTGCRDGQAAEQKLRDLITREDRVKTGILQPEEVGAAKQVKRPIQEHVDAYLVHLRTGVGPRTKRRVSAAHCDNVKRQIKRLIQDMGLTRITDLSRDRVEHWMRDQETASMGGRTLNTYRAAISGFCRWAVEYGRLVQNPLEWRGSDGRKRRVRCADETSPSRVRRPFTLEELSRLFQAARERPLVDAVTIWRGSKKGQRSDKVKLSDEQRRQLEMMGFERYLIYAVMAYTGLRYQELATRTVGDLHLDAAKPYISISSRDSKNARDADLPLPSGLVPDLKAWLDCKLAEHNAKTLVDGRREVAAKMPLDTLLFNVPTSLLTSFDRDLVYAGIAKTNERGETLDLHCLRLTYATLLARAGVSLAAARELMRHSKVDLTAKVYTKLNLIDKAKAVESLTVVKGTGREMGRAVKTGTDPVAAGTDGTGDAMSLGGAEIRAVTQAGRVIPCHRVAEASECDTAADSPQVLAGEDTRNGLSPLGNPRQDSGWRESNPHVQLGRLPGYDHKSCSDKPMTSQDGKGVPKSVPCFPENASRQAPLPPDLAHVVAAWPTLPEHIKSTIMTLIRTATEGNTHE
jgi:integrase